MFVIFIFDDREQTTQLKTRIRMFFSVIKNQVVSGLNGHSWTGMIAVSDQHLFVTVLDLY